MKTEKERYDKRHAKLIDNCPGLWFANYPALNIGYRWGNVTVDAEKTVEAILYLRKYYRIDYTQVSSNTDNGILIGVTPKQ